MGRRMKWPPNIATYQMQTNEAQQNHSDNIIFYADEIRIWHYNAIVAAKLNNNGKCFILTGY